MPDTRTQGHAGLMTASKEAVPLAGVAIDAEISASCARVAVTQRYVNREDTPIEAVYLFPLDEGAAVCGFEAVIDGTLVVGEVFERDEAFKKYDDAMQRGDGAFLLDEERPDVFQASVGNLPPGKEVLLKLTYVTELTVDGGALRFTIPTTVAPRYAPAEDQRGVGRPDSEALNAPRAWRVPYGLDLSIRLAMPGAISRVESPSHPIAVETDGTSATVSLSQRDAALDRDFVLSVAAQGLDRPQASLERGDDGSDAIALVFVPSFESGPVASEVIFLVDRSGSMDGTSIAEVRNALQLCLRSLTSGCRFNIIGFGDRMDALFKESRAYDDASLQEASEYVAGLKADLGGTEILPALKSVLGAPRQPKLARQVIVLTDGEVTNTDAVLALARQHHPDARIFTFGIGAGASHHLVKGLARAGGGAVEFIYPGERIEPKVLRQFGRLLSPALTNVRVNWGGLRVTQAPSAVPPVFAGSRLLLYAFAESPIEAPATVRLEADTTSGALSFDVPIDPARMAQGRTVTTLAARARIRELEESPEWTTARGSRQRDRKASAVSKEIIELATKYGLMSRETSYVAIEKRETPVEGDVQLRRVPIALTAGWGALQDQAYGRRVVRPGLALGLPAAAPSASFEEGIAMARRLEAPDYGSQRHEMLRGFPSMLRRAIRPARRADRAFEPQMQHIIRLQRADGSWELTERFADAIGVPLSALETALGAAASEKDRTAWATALAVAWLQANAATADDEWRMIADKALRWLEAGRATDSLARASEFLRLEGVSPAPRP